MTIKTAASWKDWLIRVKPNTTYAFGPLDFDLFFFDLSYKNDLRINTISSTEPNIITSGPNSYWVSVTQAIDRDMSNWMLVEGDIYPAEYVSGYPEWVAEPKAPETTQKRIAFMGDSITAGVATTKIYHMYLHEKYGFKCLNYGYGGAGFYRSYPGQTSGKIGFGNEGMGVVTTTENAFTPNNVVARLAELDSETIDGIVIFAGTNDWGNSVSVENYISGIESAFDYCRTNLTGIPLFVMTPIHRKNDTVPNSQNKTLREYVDILIDECKKYGVPYVDCMTMCGIYPDNQTVEAMFFRDGAGLHPNEKGHKWLAAAVGETIKSVMSAED